MHLPHYAVTTEDARAVHVLARQPIDLSQAASLHERGKQGVQHAGLDAAGRRRAGDVLVVDSTVFSTLFGGDESLERFWKNIADGRIDVLELDDIQSGVLRPRPAPYAATYILLRIDDRRAGRELMGRLGKRGGLGRRTRRARRPTPGSASRSPTRASRRWAFPQDSLDSFAWEFRQGMAARANALGDTGESSPEHWERPLGTSDVHVVLTALSPDQRAARSGARARAARRSATCRGSSAIWRQDCHALSTGKEPFGFRDGIGHPAVEGSGIPGSNSHEPPFKAGEFVLGYPDETGGMPPDAAARGPGPQRHLRGVPQAAPARGGVPPVPEGEREQPRGRGAAGGEDDGAMAQRRAPGALPVPRRPGAGRRSASATTTSSSQTTRRDTRRRPASHIRRANPRDASVAGVVRLHRMIRRGTAYGPELPEGVLEDDGVDRGLMFAFVGAHLGRQFEFVQSEWINGGDFLGLGDVKDPDRGRPRRDRRVFDPAEADSEALARPAAVRRHARRRVLLHAGAARPALARRASDMTPHADGGRPRASAADRRVWSPRSAPATWARAPPW